MRPHRGKLPGTFRMTPRHREAPGVWVGLSCEDVVMRLGQCEKMQCNCEVAELTAGVGRLELEDSCGGTYRNPAPHRAQQLPTVGRPDQVARPHHAILQRVVAPRLPPASQGPRLFPSFSSYLSSLAPNWIRSIEGFRVHCHRPWKPRPIVPSSPPPDSRAAPSGAAETLRPRPLFFPAFFLLH